MHDLRFEGDPTLSHGYLYWRVVNKDVEAVPANESMGDIEVVTNPDGAPVIDRSPSPLSQPLQPGDSEGYQLDLQRHMQIDGQYYVSIHLLRENRVIAVEVRDGLIHPS